MGYRNRFRHPNAEVWARWSASGAGILRTDASGNITYAALNQYLVKKDDVIRFYYVACPTETGYHTGGTATCTSGAASPGTPVGGSQR